MNNAHIYIYQYKTIQTNTQCINTLNTTRKHTITLHIQQQHTQQHATQHNNNTHTCSLCLTVHFLTFILTQTHNKHTDTQQTITPQQAAINKHTQPQHNRDKLCHNKQQHQTTHQHNSAYTNYIINTTHTLTTTSQAHNA